MNIHDILHNEREVIEAFCRKHAQYAFLGGNTGLCRVLGKYKLYVDTRDISLTPNLIVDGFWESWITMAMRRIKPGWCCIDVGANCGYFSMLMADLVGETGKVYAFEPQPDLNDLIDKSARVNGFRHLKVSGCAVSDASGQSDLVVQRAAPDNFGSAALVAQPGVLGVTTVTLDAWMYLIQGGPAHFIKVDAEGHEESIWAGMQQVLRDRPIVLLEFTPKTLRDPKGFLAELADYAPLREVSTTGNPVAVEAAEVLDRGDFSMLWLEP
jgi:FkbM family methyltransferase